MFSSNSAPCASPTSLILCEERTALCGLLLCHRLYRHADGSLFMTVSYQGERCAAALGNDFRAAVLFFFSVADGLVTPCTFFEVLEDENMGFFQKISLQTLQNML